MNLGRRAVAHIGAIKAAGRKISMLYATTLEQSAAANAAIDMRSIGARFFSAECAKRRDADSSKWAFRYFTAFTFRRA